MHTLVLCISLYILSALNKLPKLGERRITHFSKDLIDDIHFSFLSRKSVDSDQMLEFGKAVFSPQVLPYFVIKWGNKFLTYSRGKSTEVRLTDMRSIGFGGHIDLQDSEDISEIEGVIQTAALREFEEELGIVPTDFVNRMHFDHMILDYTNTVGMVHLGLLAIFEVTDEEAQMIDPDHSEIKDAKWQTLEDLIASADHYESWSQAMILGECHFKLDK